MNNRATSISQILHGHRLALFSAAIAVAVLVGLHSLNRSALLNSVDRVLLEETDSHSRLLAKLLAESPVDNPDDASALLRAALETSRSPMRLDLVDREGRIVASTESTRIGKTRQTTDQAARLSDRSGSSISIDSTNGLIEDFLALNIGRDSGRQPIGAFLAVERDVTEQRRLALDGPGEGLVREILAIVLSIGVGCLLMHARVNHRVASLLGVLDRFKNGEWSARSTMDGRSVIAQIAQCIDALLDCVIQEREELRFSEAKIKAVLETATDGIIGIDAQGRVQSMNSAAERIFGYSKNQVIGHNVTMLMPEPFTSEHDDYINRYLETGQKRIIGIGREVSGLRSDGAVFPMELSVSALEFGNERSFTGIVRDISARKRTEEQLRLSEEQLHLTVENAPIGIVTCDIECRILNANRACTKIVGYSREELLSMDFPELVHPDERRYCLEFAQKAKNNQLESTTIQQRWIHRNGSEVSGILHIAVINSDENAPKMFVIQMEDYTDQLNAEAEARQLRDRIAHVARITTLGEMVAGIAHEINQPLAAIANYTDASQRLIKTGTADPEDLMHAMKQASEQAHRAAQVLQRLRDFAKMRSIQREKVDLNALVKDVVALANMENPNLRSMITLEFEDHLPELMVDPIQIQQVILNLIRNGVDAMQDPDSKDQAMIIRTINENSDYVRIEIVDRGSGVDAESSDKIFDPFYSTKLSGMGLGLSICRSIARSHGGQLEFKNNGDRGATFYLRLPTLRS